MIRKRRDGLQVQVDAGRDPLTGRKRWVSRQVPGQTKRTGQRGNGERSSGRERQAERGDFNDQPPF